MAHNQPSHSWLGRFSAQLLRIKPDLNVMVAVKHAVATQPYAEDLEPEKAARIFADSHPGLMEASLAVRRRAR